MRVVIIGLIFVAVILAGGTAYMLRDYLSAQQAEIAALKPKAPTVEVLIAATDMPVGTVVNENNTDWLDWPEELVPEGFLARVGDIDPLAEISKDKHLVRRSFSKGEPITMARLYKSDAPGFLRGTLTPGMRAIAVRTSPEVGAGGFILPGDRIDLVLTHAMFAAAVKAQGDARGTVAIKNASETIMENLRVLAIDQKTTEFEGGAALGKTILLEATPKQVETINTAKSMGSLSLSLRSAEDGEARTDVHYTTDVEVSPLLSIIVGTADGGTPTKAAVSAAPMPVYTPPAKPSKKEITVYRGGQPGAAQ